jgi:formate/nitrite transporter FocA (FNT family)
MTDAEFGVDQTEPRKPLRRILEHEIAEGLGEIERSTGGLLLAGLAAGLEIGFSVFLIAVVFTLTQDELSPALRELLMANAYTIGYIFVILGRSELFTEHTTLAILPVLHGSATVSGLVRLWGLIYVSNLVGGTIFAGLLTLIGPALHAIDPDVFSELATQVVAHPWWVILLSAMLTGWLMGLLSWLVAAGRDTTSQIIIVWLVTAAIGLSHLHHSIVGSIEVIAALFALTQHTWGEFAHFLLWATLGNAFGGFFFVAVLKYSHVTRSPVTIPTVQLEEE